MEMSCVVVQCCFISTDVECTILLASDYVFHIMCFLDPCRDRPQDYWMESQIVVRQHIRINIQAASGIPTRDFSVQST
jgi:hypothetical protein